MLDQGEFELLSNHSSHSRRGMLPGSWPGITASCHLTTSGAACIGMRIIANVMHVVTDMLGDV